MPEIIARCQPSIDPACHPTHLVTVVGIQRAVTAQAAAILRASHCLLIHEQREEGTIPRNIVQELIAVETFLTERRITPIRLPFRQSNRQQEQAALDQQLRERLAGIPSDRIAFDLTPGFKWISIALAELAPAGSWLIYCRHDQTPGIQAEPFSERYDIWQKPNA